MQNLKELESCPDVHKEMKVLPLHMQGDATPLGLRHNRANHHSLMKQQGSQNSLQISCKVLANHTVKEECYFPFLHFILNPKRRLGCKRMTVPRSPLKFNEWTGT